MLASVPRSTAAGHQLGLGHHESSSFPMCSPKRIPKVRNLHGGRERGWQGCVVSFPVWHLHSRAGAKPPELLSQLMNSQIPEIHPNPKLLPLKLMLHMDPGTAKAGAPLTASTAACHQP